MADSLAVAPVGAIMEERSGALWFGSDQQGGGVTRYDGATLVVVRGASGLPSPRVTCMLADRSSRLWFGTATAGLSRYEAGAWTRFTSGDLTSNLITCLFEDDSGRVWVGTQSGINLYDVGWTRFSAGVGGAPGQVKAITQDLAGRIWVATNSDLRRWDGAAWAIYSRGVNLYAQVPTGILALRRDGHGGIWLSTSAGVAGFDPGRDVADSTAWRIFRRGETVLLNQVKAIELDARGNVWFGHAQGVSRFDGRRWHDLPLSITNVDVLHPDRFGNLWIGSPAGVSVFDGVTWELLTVGQLGVGCDDDTAPGGAQAVYQDSTGALWFGTCGGGVMRNDPAGWTTFLDSLPSPRVSSVRADSTGALWFGTDGGAVRYDGHRWKTFGRGDGLASDTVRAVLPGPLGSMWFATTAGLSAFDGTTWRTYGGPADGLIDPDVVCLALARSGTLWIGTARGASSFDGTTWRSYPVPDPIPSAIRAIAEDRLGRIWFGTMDGLRVLAGSSWTSWVAGSGTFADNSIEAILVDEAGIVWVGDALGISRFDGFGWATLNGTYSYVAPRSMWEDRSGDLWFGIPHRAAPGATEGAVRHGPDRVPAHAVVTARPPAVSASRIQTLRFQGAFKESQGVVFSHSLDGAPYSSWSPETFWVARDLGDFVHHFTVKARDPLLQVDPAPDTSAFEVDATAPGPTLSFPAAGDAVRDSVAIRGSTADQRFRSYRVLVRAQGAASWSTPPATELARDSTTIVNGVLAGWNTRAYPDGYFELRAEVTDTLGLVGSGQITVQVDNHAPSANQTSPVIIQANTGGDVFTLGREVHLYLPPHAFASDTKVTIDSLPGSQLPDPKPGGGRPLGAGWTISWEGRPLAKPALVDWRVDPASSGPTSLWRRDPSGTWWLVGGTSKDGLLSAAISDSGAYAVFQGGSSPGLPTEGLRVTLTPRVYSRSAFGAGQVGISFELQRPGRVWVTIYDRAGRPVRDLAHDVEMPQGANVLRWDGRGRHGGLVSDGLYLVAVRALGEHQVREVAVIK